MESKKINQLATNVAPVSTDLTIIGDPITGVSKKITLLQLASIFSGSIAFYTNYAAFPATGTVNTIYCAKDTNKLYLWSGSAYVETFPSQALLDTYQLRSEKGVSNGYASLDSAGKVPISQLPSSIMEYKGMWSATTNTPTLANGTGDTGDVYICNGAGSVNFGAGAITFAVGDYVVYSGTIWQRSSGAVGTVTSVGLSTNGNSITIGSSPITTSGTITANFAGTSLQYIDGAGNLTTFPSLTGYIPYTGATSSIDLNNQSVVNISHLGINTTTVPTILIRAVGDNNSSSRIAMRGYSSNANSSSIRVTKFRGTAGAPQAPLSGDSLGKFELAGYGTTSSEGYPQASFEGIATENWGATARGSKTVIKITPNTTTTQAIALTINQDKSAEFENSVTGTSLIKTGGTSSQFLKADGSVDSSAYITLGSLSATSPIFYNNTTGVISSQAASATLEGYVTTGTQTIAGLKAFNDAITGNSGIAFLNGVMPPITNSNYSGIGGNSQGISIVTRPVSTNYTNNLYFPSASNSYTFPNATGTIALVGGSGVGTVTSVAALTLDTTGTDLSSTVANSTTTPVITLNVPTASATNRGALSSADWTTFNSKYNLPSLTSGSVLYSNGTTIAQNNANFFWDNTNVRLGIGTTSPSAGVTVYSTTAATQFKAAGTAPAFTFSDTLVSSTYACVFGLATSANHFVTGTAAGDMAIANQSTSAGAIVFGTGTTEKMRMTSTGKFSIGNTNDTYTLDVSGTGYFSGIVGIGVAPSAWYTSSGYATLQVGNASLFGRNSANSELYLSSNVYDNTSGNPTYITTDFAARYVQDDGVHSWLTAPSGTAGTATTLTERMRITQAGNVGIGSSTANNKLSIVDSSYDDYSLRLESNSGNTANRFGGIGFAGEANNTKAAILFVSNGSSYSRGSIVFSNNDESNQNNATLANERMRITSGGNVNINGSGFSDVKFYVKGSDATSSNYAALFVNGSASNLFNIRNDGAVQVFGSLSKGSGSFRIDHPLESMTETHQLVHSFIEGPQADLIYRGKLTLVNGKAQANIDIVSTMTDGTFEALCREVQCFTTNESGWDLVKGKVIGNIIYIESQNTNSTDEISWMVIGERKDKHIMDTDWTDENGKVIVEPLKIIEPTKPTEPTI
jgi:hypothetical protein